MDTNEQAMAGLKEDIDDLQEKISDDARKEARDGYRDAEDALWVEGE